jgi:hypothetical protein
VRFAGDRVRRSHASGAYPAEDGVGAEDALERCRAPLVRAPGLHSRLVQTDARGVDRRTGEDLVGDPADDGCLLRMRLQCAADAGRVRHGSVPVGHDAAGEAADLPEVLLRCSDTETGRLCLHACEDLEDLDHCTPHRRGRVEALGRANDLETLVEKYADVHD